MKKIVAAILLIGLTSTFALAEWLVDFKDNVVTEGIEIAVDKALAEGADAATIVENSIAIETVNPQNLIKALYCGGIPGEEIKALAGQYNISEMIVEAGFQKSVAECGVEEEDVQPYTEVNAQGPSFSGTRSGGGNNNVFASPSAP